MPAKHVPLDTLLLSLRDRGVEATNVTLNHEPPRIFYSSRPASLVVFMVLQCSLGVRNDAVGRRQHELERVLRFRKQGLVPAQQRRLADCAGCQWTLDCRGPPAPAFFKPARGLCRGEEQIPGRRWLHAMHRRSSCPPPRRRSSSRMDRPASLRYRAPRSTMWPTRRLPCFAIVRRKTLYYLVSGRWFSAPGFDGPWQFATNALPPDFARIRPTIHAHRSSRPYRAPCRRRKR